MNNIHHFTNRNNEVLKALPQDCSCIRFNQLFDKIGENIEESNKQKISKSTLANCLKHLEFVGYIQSKKMKNSGRGRTGVEYSLVTDSNLDFLKIDKNIEHTLNKMGKFNDNYDVLQLLGLNTHIKSLTHSLLIEIYRYSTSKGDEKAKKRFDTYLKSCHTPYINEIIKLVESPYTLEGTTYDTLLGMRVFSKTQIDERE